MAVGYSLAWRLGSALFFCPPQQADFQASVSRDATPIERRTRVLLFRDMDRLSEIEGRSFVSSIIYLGAKLKHKPRSFDAQRDPSPPKNICSPWKRTDVFLLRRNNDSAGFTGIFKSLQIRLPWDKRACPSYLSRFQFPFHVSRSTCAGS